MAFWHLYRMETDPNVGPLSLECLDGEEPVKFTLFDSNAASYDATTACVPVTDDADAVLELLTTAGYTPSEWHS